MKTLKTKADLEKKLAQREAQWKAAMQSSDEWFAEYKAAEKDAERYRKLKNKFHRSQVMSDGFRWWDAHIRTLPGYEQFNDVIDALPEVE